ncbi:serine threonine protein kinase [Stylonychia lemnae]|uniref:Casein kinase I n=1 Tax=Stylonychia lemnae TaxID=5949 RepID=A0A078AAU2_STYLE|nr:serine threonine protein kinase [Stylonychia lemnae]|eukprot:CDW77908.1 serine threonine protein kinase [Stylonychia lemnae]
MNQAFDKSTLNSISSLKQIHSLGYIRRDVKLDNIFIHNGKIKFIDFGSVDSYFEKDSNTHIKDYASSQIMRGSPCTALINSHNSKEMSRRDDLISAIYSIMQLHRKQSLQWLQLCEEYTNQQDKDFINQQIYLMKQHQSPNQEDYKDDIISQNLICLLKYLEEIGFSVNPDYDFLIKCLNCITDQSEFIQIFSPIAPNIVYRYQLKQMRIDTSSIISIDQKQTNQKIIEENNSSINIKSTQARSLSLNMMIFNITIVPG